MKKLLFIAVMLVSALGMSAQKFALVDMEYILKNIPAYERANEQLSQVAKKWQAEVDAMGTEVQTLYKNYQNESVFLSQEQKKARQEAILAKEKEASELKKKYFGPEGELFKKRTSLMTPIQEEIYNAVKDISELRGYSCSTVLQTPASSSLRQRWTSAMRCLPSSDIQPTDLVMDYLVGNKKHITFAPHRENVERQE